MKCIDHEFKKAAKKKAAKMLRKTAKKSSGSIFNKFMVDGKTTRGISHIMGEWKIQSEFSSGPLKYYTVFSIMENTTESQCKNLIAF